MSLKAVRRVDAVKKHDAFLVRRDGGFALLERLPAGSALSAEAYRRRAEIAATISHPKVVKTLEVLDGDGGQISEYVSGERLGYILDFVSSKSMRIPEPLACQILIDVAEALQAAHGGKRIAKAIHGHLSADVIFVGYDGSAKLGGFGQDPAAGETDASLANPLYMSPEQIRGEKLSGATDSFGLGALAHEMLTSKRLFSGPSPKAISNNVLNRKIPPPSVYNPTVKAKLDDLVCSLLERDPAKRASAARVCEVLLSIYPRLNKSASRTELAAWLREHMAARYSRRIAEEEAAADEEGVGPAEAPLMFPEAGVRRRITGRVTPLAANELSGPTRVSTGDKSGPAAAGSKRARRPAGLMAAIAILLLASAGYGAWTLAAKKGGHESSERVAAGEAGGQAVTDVAAEPAPAEVEIEPEPPTVPEPPSAREVQLLLTVTPAGSTVSVGDKVIIESSPSGEISIPLEAAITTTVKVSKEGFQSVETELEAPATGSTPLTIALVPDPVVVEQPPPPPTPEPKRRRIKAVNVAPRPPPRTATLVVRVAPVNANLTVDGVRRMGTSPHRLELRPGEHRLSATAAGFDTASRTVRLDPGASEAVELSLTKRAPAKGTVNISSTPSGAIAVIAGRTLTTPVRGQALPVGSHSVRVTKRGFKPWVGSVQVRSGEQTTVSAALVAVPAPEPPPSTPVDVSASSVQKISGSLPAISVAGDKKVTGKKTKPISARLCLSTSGKVTSAKLNGRLPPKLHMKVLKALRAWRYRPTRIAGRAVPVCFSTTFRLDIIVN